MSVAEAEEVVIGFDESVGRIEGPGVVMVGDERFDGGFGKFWFNPAIAEGAVGDVEPIAAVAAVEAENDGGVGVAHEDGDGDETGEEGEVGEENEEATFDGRMIPRGLEVGAN